MNHNESVPVLSVRLVLTFQLYIHIVGKLKNIKSSVSSEDLTCWSVAWHLKTCSCVFYSTCRVCCALCSEKWVIIRDDCWHEVKIHINASLLLQTGFISTRLFWDSLWLRLRLVETLLSPCFSPSCLFCSVSRLWKRLSSGLPWQRKREVAAA